MCPKPPICEIVLELIKLKAHMAPVKITTTALAESTGLSQQTISNRLIALERQMKITRSENGIAITPEFARELKGFAAELKINLEEGPERISMRGRVVSGIGDGKYYMSLDGYRKQFAGKFGFTPYKGTLNLEIGTDEIENRIRLKNRQAVEIASFSDEHRGYGALRAYVCKIKKGGKSETGAIIFPERSHHGINTLEIVSEKFLRKALGLKDGEEAEVLIK
ncbi:riboflavin kinase [Candidatus Micrarchaeota archaeon CG08_land_8_20_14_0_20_49_17]|nr:MAG: riboflavin kinase [Candidatus Micrarchaeota archaeon CG08_land_8_20_14_0_20_49_17]PIU81292.1 MAG: riboflavin kinase [Candidatus Micrarchaeota archaeon CG06_land_8_20_14_3_00_50_6]PIZ94638.1 MAG: riboflavin kinase [Candidatus Micrarchaeota archaeon CG_4_10_14_0_2_um_filter_49_7]